MVIQDRNKAFTSADANTGGATGRKAGWGWAISNEFVTAHFPERLCRLQSIGCFEPKWKHSLELSRVIGDFLLIFTWNSLQLYHHFMYVCVLPIEIFRYFQEISDFFGAESRKLNRPPSPRSNRLKYPPEKWKRWAVQQFRRPEVLSNVLWVVVEQLEKYREIKITYDRCPWWNGDQF